MPQPWEFQPTVNTGGLPPVGVTAMVAGAKQFFSDMSQIEQWMGRVGSASSRLAGVSSSAFRTVGSAMSTSAAVMLAATSAMQAAGGAAVVMASTLQSKMTIAAAALGTTEDAIRGLSDAAIEMSRTAPISIREMADATVELSKAGINLEKMSQGALKAAANLMIASGGELTIRDAALLVAGGMNAFNISGAESARVADALTAAANSSAITFRDLRLSFQQVSAPAAALNYTIEETTTMLGLLGRSGLRGSDAGTSLKQMFIALLAPAARARELIAKYGMTLFDANGNAISARGIIDELNKAFGDEAIAAGKVTEAERAHALAVIFGSDAWRAATILARQGTKAYDDMAQAARNLSAEEMASKMLGAVNVQFQVLRNNVEAAAVIIGREALPALGALLGSFNKIAQSIKPQVFELVGKALVASFTGTNVTGVLDQAKYTLGQVFPVFEAWFKLLIEVRSAIVERIVPAFYTLFNVIGQGKPIGDILVDTFNSISSAVRDVSTAVSKGVTALANILNQLRNSTVGLVVVETVFRGLSALPLVALAAVVAKVASSFLGLGGSTFAVALAIGAVSGILPKTTQDWTNLGKTLSGYVYPALIAVSAVMTYLAVTQLVSLAAPIVTATAKIIAFTASVVAATISIGAFNLLQLIRSFGLVGTVLISTTPAVVKAVIGLGLLAAQAIATAAALTVLFIVKTVGSAFTVASELVAGFMLVLRGGMGAISVTSWALGVLTAAIQGLKLGTLISGLAGLASSAVAAGGALLTSFAGAITAAATAIAPFIVGIIAIGAAVGLLYLAWTNNWLGIQGVAETVIKFVEKILIDFFNFMRGLPIVGEVIKWAEGAVKTVQEELPKMVDVAKNTVNDIVDEFQSGFPRIRKLLSDMMTVPEFELPAGMRAPTARADTWEAYNLGARQAKRGVDEWTDAQSEAAAAAEAAGEASRSAMSSATRHVKDLREEVQQLTEDLKAAEDEMRKWSDPRLLGMGAAEDAIFELEQASKKAQIAEIQAKLGIKDTNKELEAQFDILGAQQRELTQGVPVALTRYQWLIKQRQKAEEDAAKGSTKKEKLPEETASDTLKQLLELKRLEYQIQFEPQLRAAKKLYDQLKGTDKEVTFQQALDNMLAANKVATELEPKLKVKKDELKAAEQALEAQQEAANGYKDTREQTLEIEDQILDRYQRMTIQLNAQKDALGYAFYGKEALEAKSPWEKIPSGRYDESKFEAIRIQNALGNAENLDDVLDAINASYKDLGKFSLDYAVNVIKSRKEAANLNDNITRSTRSLRDANSPLEIMGKKIKDISGDWSDVGTAIHDTKSDIESMDEAIPSITKSQEAYNLVASASFDIWASIASKIDDASSKVGPDTPLGKFLLGLKDALATPAGATPESRPRTGVKAYQHGTMFAQGGLSLVGEAGPEIVHLPRGSQVFPTRATNYSSQSTVYNDQWNISGAQNPIDVWGVVQRRLRMQRITGGR